MALMAADFIGMSAAITSAARDGVSVCEAVMAAGGTVMRTSLDVVLDSLHVALWSTDGFFGDGLEVVAARAVMRVDEALEDQVVASRRAPSPVDDLRRLEDLRSLQRICNDIAILARSRFIPSELLMTKGIPPGLAIRTFWAFPPNALGDHALWSRLGNSKHHVFTDGIHFKKHRHGRGGRGNRRLHHGDPMEPMYVADDLLDDAQLDVLELNLDEPCFVHLVSSGVVLSQHAPEAYEEVFLSV